jgi:hypothetical protein
LRSLLRAGIGCRVLIPLALAVLLTFLLSPVVSTLQRRGLGRAASVLVTVLLALSILGGIGWTLARQMVTLADELPGYSLDIHHRIADLRGASKGGSVEKVQKAVEDVVGELQKTGTPGVTRSTAGRGRPGSPIHSRPPAKPPPGVGERGGRDGARDLHAARTPGHSPRWGLRAGTPPRNRHRRWFPRSCHGPPRRRSPRSDGPNERAHIVVQRPMKTHGPDDTAWRRHAVEGAV